MVHKLFFHGIWLVLPKTHGFILALDCLEPYLYAQSWISSFSPAFLGIQEVIVKMSPLLRGRIEGSQTWVDSYENNSVENLDDKQKTKKFSWRHKNFNMFKCFIPVLDVFLCFMNLIIIKFCLNSRQAQFYEGIILWTFVLILISLKLYTYLSKKSY